MPIPPSRRRPLTDDEFSAMVTQELVCPHVSRSKEGAASTRSWTGRMNERFWAHKTDHGRPCDEATRVEVSEFLARLHAHRPELRLVGDERDPSWVNIGWTKAGWAEQRRDREIALTAERVRLASGLED